MSRRTFRTVFIDSHAHIDSREFDKDRQEMLDRARDAGVECIVNPGSDLESCRRARALAERYEAISYAPGLHPHDARKIGHDQWEAFTAFVLECMRSDRKPVAIGETGLDYHYDFSPRDAQAEVFRRQVRLALELDLPIIIHCREAYDDCVRILNEESPGRRWRGVIHCFTGTGRDARTVLELGFFISFAGMLTYPSADDLRQTATAIPIDRLLLETDSPLLGPQPLRKKRNEPANVVHVARTLAEIHKLSLEDVARITTANASRLFGIGRHSPGRPTIVYKIRNSLYVNLTNRCTNRCVFCSRESDPSVKGHWLRLESEPTVQQVLDEIGDPTQYAEIVFCGFGEPMLRLDAIKEIAASVKARGGSIRINTNGQADIISGRRVTPELDGLVDVVSVSLNSARRDQYVDICRPSHGEKAYDSMIEFIKDASKHVPKVIVTALDFPGVDVDACRRLAGELGVEYRQRKYNEVG